MIIKDWGILPYLISLRSFAKLIYVDFLYNPRTFVILLFGRNFNGIFISFLKRNLSINIDYWHN